MSRFLGVWLSIVSLFVALSQQSLRVFGEPTHTCTEHHNCKWQTFYVDIGTDFSFTCDGEKVCSHTKIVVNSSCTLREEGIECDEGHYACEHATINVFSSDLTTAGGSLDCASKHHYDGLCQDMDLKLVDSKIILKCRKEDCEDFKAYLYGDSTLIFYRGDDVSEESQLYFGEVTVHLFPGSTLIDNGYTDYSLVQFTTTTISPTSTQESTQLPTMISTTSTTMMPSTTKMTSTTKALVTSTSSTTPIETTTSTLQSSTEFNTTFESTAESTTESTTTTTTTAMTSTITALPKPQSGDGVSKRYKIVVPVLAAVCCVVLVVICVAVTGWYFCWKKVKTLERNVAGMEQKAEKLEIQIARGNMTADDHWDDLGLETESDEERCAILWPAAAKRISTMDDDDSDVELEYTPKPKR